MAIEVVEWWFDGQQRRFLEQIVRAFSGFQYRPGIRNGVQPSPVVIPCRMATQNRMVANIMKNLSENTVLTVPLITVSQIGLVGRREDVQSLSHISSVNASERAIDQNTGKYLGSKGNTYTIHRFMPRPFTMKIQIDIWTSNLDQKDQILEQILPIIYPSFDIQNSENGIDWSALSTVFCDDINRSSINIPVGTDSEIDVATLTLTLPIWLNPPAKVVGQKLIREIITNVNSASDDGEGNLISTGLMTQVVTTPGDYHIRVEGNEITLLNANGGEYLANGNFPSWRETLVLYGNLRPTISQLRITIDGKIENGQFVTGTIQLDPDNVNKLIWTLDIDTLPGNTLPPINAIVEPMKSYPGHGLPAAANGQRYLIFGDISPSIAWPGLTAKTNDIITYNGSAWSVAFTALTSPDPEHVLNLYTGNQLRWTGAEWDMGIDGIYGPGLWKLIL